MKLLVQRVKQASVTVEGKICSQIAKGYLVFVGIEKDDTQSSACYLANKLVNLRIFEDEDDKMNLNIKDVQGSILIVSQFTLAGDTSHGNRPGFTTAATPQEAEPLYQFFVEEVMSKNVPVQTGIFQTHMEIALVNDGPTTFILERKE